MEATPEFRLLPGLVPVRRDATHLQVGLDPPRRVVLRDCAEVRQLLSDLRRGCAPPDGPTARRAFEALHAAGLVLAPSAPPAGGVRVAGAPDLVSAVRPLLADVPQEDPALVLLVERHPVPRERLDPLVRDGLPHLVVAGGFDAWTVGPLVVPGATACLRCVDATLAEIDPRRGLVLEQLSRRRTRTPADPLLQALALPWAVRDARAYLRGDVPASWSATVTFRPTGAPEERSWGRHPHCGCAWDVIAYG